MTAKAAQEFIARNVPAILAEVKKGFTPDPGTSDLDDEQPIWVNIPLGIYRKVCQVDYLIKDAQNK